ncbi:MAG: thioesterase family protein [Alphaproteobacteria bacterium]
MKDSLAAGLAASRRVAIDRARTIGFMGEDTRVYSTPMLVQDIEDTCRDMLLEHLDEGEDSVGTRVEVDHMAATLEGMWVELSATVTEVKGRALGFEVTARDALDEVASCRHNRFVIDVAKTRQRLAAKAAKAKET